MVERSNFFGLQERAWEGRRRERKDGKEGKNKTE
jgi:hypothetical protein